jgi:hypothetical protein
VRLIILMIWASDREHLAPLRLSTTKDDSSVSFPAFGSLASTKTHQGTLVNPNPATSSIHTGPTRIRHFHTKHHFQLTSYIQLLLHVLPYSLPLTQTAVTPLDPIASAPKLSCSTRCKTGDGDTTPQHPRSVTIDR